MEYGDWGEHHSMIKKDLEDLGLRAFRSQEPSERKRKRKRKRKHEHRGVYPSMAWRARHRITTSPRTPGKSKLSRILKTQISFFRPSLSTNVVQFVSSRHLDPSFLFPLDFRLFPRLAGLIHGFTDSGPLSALSLCGIWYLGAP